MWRDISTAPKDGRWIITEEGLCRWDLNGWVRIRPPAREVKHQAAYPSWWTTHPSENDAQGSRPCSASAVSSTDTLPSPGPADRRITADELAERFHETYERLAPSFSYTTRKASAVPWSEVPSQNKALMKAVAAEILALIAEGGGE
jgi:hypothetical protein